MTLDVTTRHPVRVLIVDDSAFMRTALSRMITTEPGFEVADTACSGSDAMAKIAALDPDVVTLDVEMPGMDGLETLRAIMSQFPRPVIMVSSATEAGAETTFNALAAGAFDYVPKQLCSASLDILHIKQDLVSKIRAASLSGKCSAPRTFFKKPARPSPPEPRDLTQAATPAVVAIGSSTGGPKALQEILPLLPADLSVPILIVQHMPAGFTTRFAERLNTLCALTVHEAVHREPLLPGVVYIAPAGMHMTVERTPASRPFICLDTHPENYLHMPSVDIMMKSVAETFKTLAMGVILTGMGSDGAEGMNAIFRQGGFTIGQDESSCTVYGMPRASAEKGALTRVVPLAQIPAQIIQAIHYRKRA